jgi:acyl-CoA synthetase (AMP-forming)/AMP-acid ligase II
VDLPGAIGARARLARRPLTLGTLLERTAAAHGDRILVDEAGGPRLTHREAADLVDRWAGALARRVRPGDRVVVALPNGAHAWLACLAASRAGALPVPLNDRLTPAEADHVVADAGARLVVRAVDELDGAPPLGAAHPADPGDLAALLYTSGTTGRPKGVELTHRALLGSLQAAALWPSSLRDDEVVVALPIAHVMGFVVLVGLAVSGIRVHLLPHFRPDEVLDAIESRRASAFVGVPAMYRMLLAAGAEDRDLRCVRVWGSGADALPADVARRFKRLGAAAHLPGVGPVGEATVAEGYGMVEVGGGVAVKVSPPLVSFGLGDGVGFRLPGWRWRVVDPDTGRVVRPGGVGELQLRGPGVLRGYWGGGEPPVTDDGWLRTGDLVRRGMLGTVAFTGRAKDVVKHGGYSVYAVEVEQVVEEHPDVLEAAVVGAVDPVLGEVPAAAVRLRPGAAVHPAELDEWVADRLADYKRPRRWLVVDELPRTGTGKVRRTEVAERLAATDDAPEG